MFVFELFSHGGGEEEITCILSVYVPSLVLPGSSDLIAGGEELHSITSRLRICKPACMQWVLISLGLDLWAVVLHISMSVLAIGGDLRS